MSGKPILYTTEAPSTELIVSPIVRALEKIIEQNQAIIEQNAKIIQYLTVNHVDLSFLDVALRYTDCQPVDED